MPFLTPNKVEQLLKEAHTPTDLFARASYDDLVRALLPGGNAGDRRAAALLQRVQALHEHFRRVQELYEQLHDPPVTVTGPRRTYLLLRLLAVGDANDVHLATSAYDPETAAEPYYALKIARVPEGNALLDNEQNALSELLAVAGETTYGKYLPALEESFTMTDGFARRINVFAYEPGFCTLEQVHDRHPALDGRHLAWIFKRLLTALGFSHRQGTVHGAVLPCHVLLHAANHGLRLVGWGHSVEAGQRLQTIPTRYRAWYPPEVTERRPASTATDLFLAARCLVYLAGGDPVRGAMPETVPAAMRQFFKGCLLPGVYMRPDDAWGVLDEFDELLQQLYGPPKFHPLTMT